ncbi:hypothetical protein [Amycolatopsis taiwanensis]|uniref:hypothetical protein n=1 Tax=Amycolatopsis taiwanensis TaxID=342230 RepID=UPI0005C1B137|nr:hypothetical protein [Amycolatopsis taiwanensis]
MDGTRNANCPCVHSAAPALDSSGYPLAAVEVCALTAYVCEYRNAATNSSLGVLTITPTDPSVAPAQVAAAWQKLPDAKPVSGVGDAAVYASVSAGQKSSVLGAAKRTSEATIAVMYTGPATTRDKLAPWSAPPSTPSDPVDRRAPTTPAQ